MNLKAEAFQKYLDEKNIEAFQSEQVPDDAQNTAIFRDQRKGICLPMLRQHQPQVVAIRLMK